VAIRIDGSDLGRLGDEALRAADRLPEVVREFIEEEMASAAERGAARGRADHPVARTPKRRRDIHWNELFNRIAVKVDGDDVTLEFGSDRTPWLAGWEHGSDRAPHIFGRSEKRGRFITPEMAKVVEAVEARGEEIEREALKGLEG